MKKSFAMALGGVFAALAIVIMTLGGMIPVATYITPVLCMLLLSVVMRSCGNKIAWTWFLAVSILALLLSPDRESAAVFVALGYYPIIKIRFDKLPASWLFKGIYFNVVTILLYALLLYVIGMEQLLSDFSGIGLWGLAAALLLGNVCFFLVDRLLGILGRITSKGK